MNKKGDYKIRSNRELATLFNNLNTVAILKSQRLGWAGDTYESRGPTYMDSHKMKI